VLNEGAVPQDHLTAASFKRNLVPVRRCIHCYRMAADSEVRADIGSNWAVVGARRGADVGTLAGSGQSRSESTRRWATDRRGVLESCESLTSKAKARPASSL